MRAFEIEPTKLVMPFSDIDKANMPHFQFNAPDVTQGGKAVVAKASSSQDGLMSKEDKAKLMVSHPKPTNSLCLQQHLLLSEV